jgi:hypothetical protein
MQPQACRICVLLFERYTHIIEALEEEPEILHAAPVRQIVLNLYRDVIHHQERTRHEPPLHRLPSLAATG